MDKKTFVSDILRATREGRTDPEGVVADWIDELESVLENDELTSDEGYTLLVTREKLRRVKPEFLDNKEHQRVLELADRKIEAEAPRLLERALTVPNPEAWRQELKQFDASFEEDIDLLDQSITAVQLIDDLDDVQLLLVVAQRLGIRDDELQEQIELCEHELVSHADLFYGATIHVQSIGLTLRTDLDETDYNLAATTLKFIDLIEAAEAVEAENNFDYITPLDPELENSLVRKMRRG